jgi:hypothetical protein
VKILVCAATGHFADDVPAHCATCGRSIVHRPHAPADAVPMCEGCAAAAVAADPTPPTIGITEETLREVLLYRATTKGTQ